MGLLEYLHRVAGGQSLTEQQAFNAMKAILQGEASTAQIAAFLVALRMKGETVAELVGFARAMREMATRIEVDAGGEPLLDTCGTGGDNAGTFNISTIAAFVAAGAGVRVAKHGNRSISSACGSADLMDRLGIRLVLDPADLARALREIGIAFLFAPALHPAMRHAQPARLELKMRTVFNLLGPLANPAGANVQIVGAPSADVARLLAEALARLGLEHGFVVHGTDGLDEITTTGRTLLIEVERGAVREATISPQDFGVPAARREDLRGGDADANARIARDILAGVHGPRRDVVLVNAAAALVAAGKAATFREGMALAASAIDSGAARRKLEALAAFCGQA
ncbi:MAG: anthranilate phosphoribosyltransferase [Bryobacteraceae bacterium]